MSEPRFRCPQCPQSATDHNYPHDHANGECQAILYDLPGVLEHWRWHTQQAAELWPHGTNTARLLPGNSPALHIARMSPAFTLTLIDKLEALLRWSVISHGVDRAFLRDAVVAVVVAAGFEQVVTV